MILCSSFIAPSFLERNTVAAVHYRRTSRATFIQDVLVEIASVFAPSRYKFIRSLSATERPIRRSINVASPRATRGRGTIRIVGLLLPSTPPLPFLCSIFSTVSSLSLFSSCPRLSHRHPHQPKLFAEREPCPYTIRPGTISSEGGEIGIGILWGWIIAKEIGWNGGVARKVYAFLYVFQG